ncbi:MAG: amidohydrolase [Clostridiales Family XIII bacterium]|jgi:predicted amidohydrolase YtcJ|nr:amidohydrolase [Clostridiales Family XIII bacterium]
MNYADKTGTLDLLLFGGAVRPMDDSDAAVEAIGVKDGRVAFLGTTEEASSLTAARRVDLEGRTVLPGFIDSHIHCVTYAWYENCVKLHAAASPEDVIRLGKEHVEGRRLPQGSWVIGRGWNQDNFTEPRMLDKADLDAVSKDAPVAFLRTCGHVCAVNSKALEIISELAQAKALSGDIDMESGLLREGAARLFMEAMPPLDAEDLGELIKYAAARLNRCGVTSIHSDDLRSLPVRSKYEAMKAFRALRDAGELTVRVCCLNTYDSDAQLDEYIKDGFRTGQGDDMFRIGPVKIVTDGSLGGRTAALLEPYAGSEGDFGSLRIDLDELTRIVGKCAENGLDATIHAIGDRAMKNAAAAVRASNEKNGAGRRHGVLHAQVATQETLEEMGRQGMQAFIQPVFVGSDMDGAEKLLQNPASKKLYAWKSMLDAGVAVSGGACSPVESFDVLENIQYAVTREKLGGGPEGGWLPDERLSVRDAVRLFTRNGAYASYEESSKGSLEHGKLADMVVLDGDPFTVAPGAIKDIAVDMTLLGGKIVYSRR